VGIWWRFPVRIYSGDSARNGLLLCSLY
jgi:hypothetical protein